MNLYLPAPAHTGDEEKETMVARAMPPKPLFKLGQTVATPGALAAFEASGEELVPYITRHVTGDWGDLPDDDRKLNDDAAKTGDDRILSAYRLKNGVKVWVITERDRSVTTVLLPEDY